MLSDHILFNIYEKLSWHYLQFIDNNIANINFLWKRHCINLGLPFPKDNKNYKNWVINTLNIIINNYRQHKKVMYNKRLMNDYWFILLFSQIYDYGLRYASDRLKQNRTIVLGAVKHYGLALEYVAEHFTHDKEIVLTAVKQNGTSLNYAGMELRNDNLLKHNCFRGSQRKWNGS
jgi:Domain of unknown function (DUF4116)